MPGVVRVDCRRNSGCLGSHACHTRKTNRHDGGGWRRGAETVPQVTVVCGPPGSGKSRREWWRTYEPDPRDTVFAQGYGV